MNILSRVYHIAQGPVKLKPLSLSDSIQPAFLVKQSSNLELLHRNTWKILTRKVASFVSDQRQNWQKNDLWETAHSSLLLVSQRRKMRTTDLPVNEHQIFHYNKRKICYCSRLLIVLVKYPPGKTGGNYR